MRAALAVNFVTADIEANIAFMLKQATEAAEAGAELVLFSEGAPTGLCNDDRPDHDLPLGSPVPGPLTDRFAAVARVPAVDFLLYPFARGVVEGNLDDLISEYAEQVHHVGATPLMVNYLSAPGLEEWPYPGGAWVIGPDGTILHSLPTGQTGLLLVGL